MAPKTQARSNLARSKAARSGWPVLQGKKVPLYALSKVARSAATRSNYTSNQTFISIGSPYRDVILADKPSHYWRLNEPSGTTAVDVIGAANGTISGGVTLNQPGALADGDKAMAFDGTSGKIVTAANATSTTPFTLEVWFQRAPGTAGPLLSTRVGYPANNCVYLWTQAGNGWPTLTLDYANTSSPQQNISTGSNASDGRWHHFVAVINALNVALFLDGTVVVSPVLPAAYTGSPLPVTLGNDRFDGFGAGSIDEVAIYPYALTAEQIRTHYQCGRLGTMNVSSVVGGPGILARSVTVNDSMNNIPTTSGLTFYKFVPVEGAELVITLGSINNTHREFAGTILKVAHRYVGDLPIERNMVYDAQLIDYTWGLGRKKVSGKFTNASVATIAATIVASSPQYTLQVDPDIGGTILDEMTFTETTADDALQQLVKRVGGDYECDYNHVVHVFLKYAQATSPTIINRAHKTFRDLVWSRDLSQVATRVYVVCGGSDALEAVSPLDTLIPVSTAAWYEVGGGVVRVNQQRVNYSGVVVGGGGSLVGPGAAPSAAINAVVVPGVGVTPGLHDYAVTYVTASGESIPSPRVSASVGTIAAPTAAPALDTTKALTAGAGPDPGAHDYALTFVASSGETTPGPRVTLATTMTAPPATGPTPNPGTVGTGPDPGTHDYAVAFQTPVGITTPGPIGGQIAIANTPIAPPTAGPTTNPATSGGNVDVGTHWYYLTFMTANGETTTGPATQGTALPQSPVDDPTAYPGTGRGTGTNAVTAGWLYYSYAYRTSGGETLQSPTVEVQATLVPGPPFNTYYNVAVTAPASPDPAVTTIVFYRAFGIGNQKRQWATSGNVQTTFTDDCSNTSGPLAPTGGNTTISAGPKKTIPLTAIPTGPAGTTARRIYRTPVGGGVQRLLTTLANNSATTYTDTTADSAMVGQPGPPGVNSALVLTAVHLTNIPRATGADAAAVTSRLLYRRSAGAGLKYCGILNDNSATTFDDTLANSALGGDPWAVSTAYMQQIPLTLPLGGSFIVNRKLYRTKIGSSTLLLVATLDNVVTTYRDQTPDASLGAAAPAVNTAAAAQVQLSAIPIGAAAVLQRKVYRTAAGLSQLRLLVTLADNVTTAYNDALADAVLGANVPTSDTSLLQQPTGNVLAGSTSLPCASVASFRTAGGWAIAASQVLRYTGITGNSLSGIPASGPGSIGATLTYNVTVVAASLLTGIPTSGSGTILYPIRKGDSVDVFVQVDDLPAQAAVRAQLAGSDGIIEDEIQDRRLSATEGRARGRARLNLLAALDTSGKVGIITVTYSCRDINTRAGATVSINLGPPINLLGDFQIQRVTESTFYVPNQPPTYVVEASSVRFSFEELLRVIRDAGEN